MIYIVTGASSMLGLATCQYLSAIGHTVYAVCRPSSAKLPMLRLINGIIIVYSDLANIPEISVDIPSADVFINFAWASTSHAGRENEAIQQHNIDDALACIRTAAALGCRLFVQAGSQAEYGYVPSLITEETPCCPETPYGRAKLQVYQRGTALCKELGIGYLHLRIFSVFGENDRPWTLIMTAIDRLAKDEALDLSDCTQSWNYLYADDAARQIILLCEHYLRLSPIVAEIHNIASDDTRPLKEYMEQLRMLLNSQSELRYGAIIPARKVSLNPSVDKTRLAINFIAQYTFSDAISKIISTLYHER